MDHTTLIILQTKLKKWKTIFDVVAYIAFHAFGIPFVRESYSAVKKNARMAGNLLIIQTVLHIVSCGKRL